MPKMLRGIFRKRRRLVGLIFRCAIETITDVFRVQLRLPEGKIGAVAAIHTFGDYQILHPHLHVLVSDGLFTPDGSFHWLPEGDIGPLDEVFRHRFLHLLHQHKLISERKRTDLLSWRHSGFQVHDGRNDLIAAGDHAGRKRLAEYLLRHPFSLQKITWNASSKTVICRSKRHHTTKRNFQVFKAPDFIAAALLHLPPKGQQTVRYYGVYSNKTRGRPREDPRAIHQADRHCPAELSPDEANRAIQGELLLVEPPPRRKAREMRPLWRDLILQVWGGTPWSAPIAKGP